jgi:1-acyl-sn-glycerol-3-phosphate acyltransferase
MTSQIHPLAGVIASLARLISGASIRWVNCQPDTRQRVYFANHTSHLDFVVLWAALPREVRALARPVAAKDYWEKGRLRRYLATKVFKAVLIERGKLSLHDKSGGAAGGIKAIERMIEAMGERNSLIVFPEGTRGSGEEIGPFKSGLYYLCAKKPGLELVPVYINNLNRILPKGEFLPVPLMSTVTFGPPLAFSDAEPKKLFLERAREAVDALRRL